MIAFEEVIISSYLDFKLFFKLILLRETADDNFSLGTCIKVLYENLDKYNRSIWEFGNSILVLNDSIATKRMYLYYLRLIVFLLRNLPFSDEDTNSVNVKNVKIGSGTVQLSTKKELLLSIWSTGKVSPVCFLIF